VVCLNNSRAHLFLEILKHIIKMERYKKEPMPSISQVYQEVKEINEIVKKILDILEKGK